MITATENRSCDLTPAGLPGAEHLTVRAQCRLRVGHNARRRHSPHQAGSAADKTTQFGIVQQDFSNVLIKGSECFIDMKVWGSAEGPLTQMLIEK